MGPPAEEVAGVAFERPDKPKKQTQHFKEIHTKGNSEDIKHVFCETDQHDIRTSSSEFHWEKTQLTLRIQVYWKENNYLKGIAVDLFFDQTVM